jgi:tetratricopeptide (TPR) repeat protein
LNHLHNTEQESRTDSQDAWARAQVCFEKKAWHESLMACQQTVEANPAHFDALLLAGRAARQMGEQVIARNLLQASLDLRPGSTEALFELGTVLQLLKQHEQALECYRQVLQLDPDSAQANFDVSTVLFDMGQMEAAGKYCQAALLLQPGFLAARIRMAMIHFRLDDPHRSLETLYITLQLTPDDLNVCNLVALNKLALGLPDEAVPYL